MHKQNLVNQKTVSRSRPFEMDSENKNGSIGTLLAVTREELKGKLKPAEICVDKQTLIEATRAQNKALLSIHEQLHRLEGKLDGVEENLTKCMDEVDVKLEQWGVRFENLEKKTEVCYIIARER